MNLLFIKLRNLNLTTFSNVNYWNDILGFSRKVKKDFNSNFQKQKKIKFGNNSYLLNKD